jgi:N-acetylglucosamine kinase-like BadF-type ATPase
MLPVQAEVTGILAGLAGAVTAAQTEPVIASLRERHPRAQVSVVTDLDLVLAHLTGPGAALIVGTGAIVAARGEQGREVLVDGRGFAIGDRGSGGWIALEALRRSIKDYDLRETESALLRALRTELGVAEGLQMARALAEGGGPGARRVAALAPVVLRLADCGDRDAGAILDDAVAEIIASVEAALRRAGCYERAEVVVTGGVVAHPGFLRRLADALASHGKLGRLRRVDPLEAGHLIGRTR